VPFLVHRRIGAPGRVPEISLAILEDGARKITRAISYDHHAAQTKQA